jgi:hypothetical protein
MGCWNGYDNLNFALNVVVGKSSLSVKTFTQKASGLASACFAGVVCYLKAGLPDLKYLKNRYLCVFFGVISTGAYLSKHLFASIFA